MKTNDSLSEKGKERGVPGTQIGQALETEIPREKPEPDQKSGLRAIDQLKNTAKEAQLFL